MAMSQEIAACLGEISLRPRGQKLSLEKIPETGNGVPQFYDGEGHNSARVCRKDTHPSPPKDLTTVDTICKNKKQKISKTLKSRMLSFFYIEMVYKFDFPYFNQDVLSRTKEQRQ